MAATDFLDSADLTVALRARVEEAKAASVRAIDEAREAGAQLTNRLNEWAAAASPFKVGDQVVYVRKTWRVETTETWRVVSVTGRIPYGWKAGDALGIRLNCRNLKKDGEVGLKRQDFDPDSVTLGIPAGGAS